MATITRQEPSSLDHSNRFFIDNRRKFDEMMAYGNPSAASQVHADKLCYELNSEACKERQHGMNGEPESTHVQGDMLSQINHQRGAGASTHDKG